MAVIRSAVSSPADDLHAAAVESAALDRVGDHRVGRPRVQAVERRRDPVSARLDLATPSCMAARVRMAHASGSVMRALPVSSN